jgi:hypothetical protein
MPRKHAKRLVRIAYLAGPLYNGLTKTGGFVKTSLKLFAAIAAAAMLASPAHAEGPFRNPDNKNQNDPGEGTYPVPYKSSCTASRTISIPSRRRASSTRKPASRSAT